jgi:hypothetical protein
MKHRGTGEGGLKEGRDEFQDMIAHGLYSAEEEQIAKGYQKRLVNGVWDSSVGKLTHGELFDRLSDTIASANGLPPSAGAQTASNILASLEKYGSVDKWLKKEELPGGRYNKYYQSGIDLINTLGLKRSTGSTYTTELLPHQDEFLQWDKPLSEQSDVVRDKLAVAYSTNQPTHLAGLPHFNSLKVGNMDITLGSNADKQKAANELRHRIDTESGRSLYQIIKTELGSQKAASEYLESLGIKGVKYLDGSSRKTGEGSYNYVTFRPETEAVITHENGKRIPGAVERAYAKLRDPRSKEIMERMYPELKGTR